VYYYLKNLLDSFFLTVPSIVSAILLLILAFIVAKIVKSIILKALKLTKVDKHIDKLGIADETTVSSMEFIGKLVFIIVFLLFLPAVLDKLGMQDVSAPITMLVTQFLNFIPNIVAAVIILVVGQFAAKIIRQLLTLMLKRMHVDKLQEKAGIVSSEDATLSAVISYVVYVLILIPVIIAAFQVLNISAISDPAIRMLDKIFAFIPNIFVALTIIIVGTFIAKISGKLLEKILSGVGLDALTQRIVSEDSKLGRFSLSLVIGEIVRYIIVLLFVIEALNVLNLEILQLVGQTIIAYLPFVIGAIIIMGVALFCATKVESFIQDKFSHAHVSALIAKYVIIIVAVFMIFSHLGIAPSIVNAAFIMILGAIAVAFALAFGIGGREFAANTLKQLEKKKNDLKDE
jgi:hypothetical protein